MDSKVIDFTSKLEIKEETSGTTREISPDDVLSKAIGELSRVVLIGVDKEGYMYVASSTSEAPMILFDIEKGKRLLFDLLDHEG